MEMDIHDTLEHLYDALSTGLTG